MEALNKEKERTYARNDRALTKEII